MALKSQAKPLAPGGPGIEPRWARGAKVAVGTAYSTSSRVWYTLDSGCVTEVYYPTIDTPQIRDLQFLFTDGKKVCCTEGALRGHGRGIPEWRYGE
jgi:glucoamylase